MANVSIRLGKPIAVKHLDNELVVEGHGTLRFSMGSVEWKPAGKKVALKKYSWKDFAELLEANGKKARADAVGIGPAAKKKKAAAKKVK